MTDPVTPLGGAGPVASTQLMDFYCRRSISSGDQAGETRAHQPPVPSTGQAWTVRARGGLAAARWTVLTSTAVSAWSRELASLAISSALSLPSVPEYDWNAIEGYS